MVFLCVLCELRELRAAAVARFDRVAITVEELAAAL
jgi:hypothetical protein